MTSAPGPADDRSVLERVRSLRGVSWEWKDGTEHRERVGERRQMGVIAQEVKQAFPDAVTEDPTNGYLMVDYNALTAVLLEAVKELADQPSASSRQRRSTGDFPQRRVPSSKHGRPLVPAAHTAVALTRRRPYKKARPSPPERVPWP